MDSNNNIGINHKKPYVFINNNLSDLENSVIDLHDNAWFTNSHVLKFLVDFDKYPNYNIMNITSTKPANQSFLHEKSQEQLFEQTDINLNQWFKAIGEIIINCHKNSESNVNICYKTDPNYKSVSDCRCVSNLANLSRSYLVNFFLNSLNANFFKFKHLTSFITEQISFLKLELNATETTYTQETLNSHVKFTTQDLNVPLGISQKSLDILTEISCFLSSTCVLNLLRSELKKSVTEKKLSVYFNFFMNKNFSDGSSITRKQSANEVVELSK